MKWINAVLNKLGVSSTFTDDDVINASTEDAARDHGSAVSRLHEATQKRVQGNEALRHSIDVAKKRTNSFADFERHIQKESRRHVRRSD